MIEYIFVNVVSRKGKNLYRSYSVVRIHIQNVTREFFSWCNYTGRAKPRPARKTVFYCYA